MIKDSRFGTKFVILSGFDRKAGGEHSSLPAHHFHCLPEEQKRLIMTSFFSRIRAELFLFLLFLFAGSFFYYTVDYDNTSSRLFTVSAAVDFGVFHIDPYAPMTADKSLGEGHIYSNKAIGASLLAIPVYRVLKSIHPWRDSPPLTKGLRYGIRLVTTTFPFAVLGVILFSSARSLGAPPIRCILAACSYGFGSIAFIHAGLFSGHGIAAAFSFFSFAGLMSLKKSAEVGRSGFLLGLSAGIAALADYTAMWISGLLLVYAFCSPIGRRNKIGFLLGGLVCTSLLALYNWKCFGSPVSFSYAHQVTEPFAEGSRHGFLGIGLPDWGAVLSLLGSPGRGLFFIMPVFLLSLSGIGRMVKNPEFRVEGILITSVALGYVLMIGGFYGWHGGWTFGPRYFVPVLPFLALSMVFSNWKSIPVIVCLVVSIAQVQIVAMSLPHCPEPIQNPLPELVIPAIREGYLAETWPGWLGVPYPLAIFLYFGVCAILFVGAWTSVCQVSSPADSGHPRQCVLSWIILLWLAAIGLMACIVRTDPPEKVTIYGERLRFHREHEQVIQHHVWELAERYRRSGDRGSSPAGPERSSHSNPGDRP